MLIAVEQAKPTPKPAKKGCHALFQISRSDLSFHGVWSHIQPEVDLKLPCPPKSHHLVVCTINPFEEWINLKLEAATLYVCRHEDVILTMSQIHIMSQNHATLNAASKLVRWKLVSNDKAKCDSYEKWTNTGPDSQESWKKKKKEEVDSTKTLDGSLELLEQLAPRRRLARRKTFSPNFSNGINSVSISCNWKTFPISTNTLSKRVRASNLYWARITFSIHCNSTLQCSNCYVLQQGNSLCNLRILYITFLHSLCQVSAKINSLLLQSSLVHVCVRNFLCTDRIWIVSWCFLPW